MFNEPIDYRSDGIFDQRQAKEFNRYITSNRKKDIVLHNLLHKRCKFCSSSFSTSGCRNCCLPVCGDFKSNVNTKKLIRDLNAGRAGQFAKRIKPGSGVTVYGTAAIAASTAASSALPTGGTTGTAHLDVPSPQQRASSPRLSPSPSARNLINIVPTSQSGSSSGIGSSPVPCEDLIGDISLADMHLSLDSGNSDHDDDSPSAPSPGMLLFNKEDDSDIVFKVGTDKQKLWRFPAHSLVLEHSSSNFFTAIACQASPRNTPFEYEIDWCDPDTFEAILRYVYTQEVQIKSASGAILLFNASKSFQLGRLMTLCLSYLCHQVQTDSVLEILSFLFEFMKSHFENSIKEQNEPKSELDSKQFPSSDSNNNLCEDGEFFDIVNQLIIKCYSLVDYEAERIIMSEEFTNLSPDMVCNVLLRDTLNISNEPIVVSAINQWAVQQCKKNCKEMTDQNKRSLLGDMVYLARYLTMSLEDFNAGPKNADLLTESEKKLFEQYLHAKLNPNTSAPVKIPKDLQLHRMDVERKYVNIFSDEFLDEDDSDDGAKKEKMNDANELDGKKKKSKKSKCKRILNGIGEIVLFLTIRILD